MGQARVDDAIDVDGNRLIAPKGIGEELETYTSTGVRAPWVIEQQRAPATANLL